jgi:hypothetical protein
VAVKETEKHLLLFHLHQIVEEIQPLFPHPLRVHAHIPSRGMPIGTFYITCDPPRRPLLNWNRARPKTVLLVIVEPRLRVLAGTIDRRANESFERHMRAFVAVTSRECR